uniref:Uncharacterized protein n=1 Tax=Dicranema revolutum TaxID=239144 RepID=A0A4D6WV13_9FLOR|nr:hypothetical protein [Dicranema revolutum]
MNHKSGYQEILNLVFISLKALDIYSIKNNNKYSLSIKERIKNFHYSQKNNIKLIHWINFIYLLMQINDTQNSTSKILSDYCYNIDSQKMEQYLIRFQYIYRQKLSQYKLHIYNIKIKEIAIKNLYIIGCMQRRGNIYNFFKYISIIQKDIDY